LVTLFSACPICSGPFAYGGPSCSVKVAVGPLSSCTAPTGSSVPPFPSVFGCPCCTVRPGLCCHAYRSSVHCRRYFGFVGARGRGGKLDLGSRSVLDHDARRMRVGVSIIASWAGGTAERVDDGGSDIFETLHLTWRWFG
jgi:hypothetical protein